MKQLIAIAAIFFAFSFTTKAQSVYYSTRAYSGNWNAYTQAYTWNSPNYTDIRFTIQGNMIMVGNRANDNFNCGTQYINRFDSDGSHIYGWYAVDKDGVSCTFKIIRNTDGSQWFQVLYSNIAFSYFIPAN